MTSRALIIVVLLAAGALINTSIALTCASRCDVSKGRQLELYTPLGESHHWEVFRWQSPAGSRIMSRVWEGRGPAECNEGDPGILLSGWGGITAPDPAAPQAGSQIDEGWGVPLRSIGRHLQADDSDRPASLEPLWVGFAADTVVYSLAVLVLYALGRDACRALRQGRSFGWALRTDP